VEELVVVAPEEEPAAVVVTPGHLAWAIEVAVEHWNPQSQPYGLVVQLPLAPTPPLSCGRQKELTESKANELEWSYGLEPFL